jgi:NADH-quinone oxidoreductase subunit C
MRTPEELKQDIESKVGGAQVTVEEGKLIVGKDQWVEIAKFLKESPSYRFDFLSSVTGVDYADRLEAVYNLFSIEKKEGEATIKVTTDKDKCEIPSVTSIWRSAEFQEREAYDLVGIRFTGHPDLRRILMWEGFEHHPLRKNYKMEDQDREPALF